MSRVELSIKRLGAPCLWRPSLPVGEKEMKKIRPNLDRMTRLLKKADGMALAAPQVGINRRFWVDEFGNAVVNPEIIDTRNLAMMAEGCLSIPDVWVEIERPAEVHLRYFTIAGSMVEVELSGLKARMVLHEVDHLDGLTIFDRMSSSQIEDFAKSYRPRPTSAY